MPETLLTAWLRKPTTAVASPTPQPQKKSYATAAAPEPEPVKRDKISSYTPALTLALDSEDVPPSAPPAPPGRPKKPPFSPLRPLPPNITLVAPHTSLLPAFKLLNQSLFPIPYPPAFYAETLADPITASITLFALWHRVAPAATQVAEILSAYCPPDTEETVAEPPPTLIGAVRCRLVHPDDKAARSVGLGSGDKPTLYVATLCVLPTYREHGCASHLVARVVTAAAREHGVGSVTAHVWEANTEGREWYKRRGFVEQGLVEGYYRRLRPSGAVLVKRVVGVQDLVGW
ncbi:acyl-CoA N-acyltransferase [Lophium mytilinum]|uniref:Acyl-CoA N-acyltransferase n=1 Tax=Lophium mytilinum TaxID=390894 RepID=A0A6A6R4W4_9PEZI|nr:acyl-CoA N-acyltransferase [Lophium mytilinum]